MKRGSALAVATLAVAAGAAGGGWAYGYGPLVRHTAPPAQSVPVSTAIVRLGTLTVSEQDAGTLGYASPLTVYSGTAGTVTWLPAPGAVIGRGQRLYAMDGQDVFALHGQTPAWRAFSPGMTDGADVAELQRNLIALGYDPYHDVTVDSDYGWATQAAVERWQQAHGMTVNAVIPLGEVTFVPGTVRVSVVQAEAGAPVTPSTALLTVTSTTPMATVALAATEAGLVRAGQGVTIGLPDGTMAAGRILQVGNVGGSSGSSGSGSSGSGSGGSGSGGSSGQTVTVTASVNRPVTGMDGASVQVTITTQAVPRALIVPISALIPGPGDGYQVTVVSPNGTRRNVPVAPGPFDDIHELVAITGAGITAGTQVEVPTS